MPRTAATRQSTEGENEVIKYARSYVTDKVNFWQGKLQELNSGNYNGAARSLGQTMNGTDNAQPAKRRRMSPEARKRISEASKARWARTRKEQEDQASAAARAAKGGKRKGAKRGRPRKNVPTAAAATE